MQLLIIHDTKRNGSRLEKRKNGELWSPPSPCPLPQGEGIAALGINADVDYSRYEAERFASRKRKNGDFVEFALTLPSPQERESQRLA
jgi:hypothetical protein